jgi:prephenate dehydrogenase
MFEQLGLIGCGLMGGSFALALKRAGLVGRVVGYSKSTDTTARALALGVIDVVAASAADAAAGSDLVLVAVPVAATERTLQDIRDRLTSRTLVMDVGSTKGDVIQAATRGLRERVGCFVPAHPIAGKEVSGVDHADADLYVGKHVVLTPMPTTLAPQLRQAEQVWQALGARVVQMAPDAHDAAFAAVSHLPHLLAFAMMHSLALQPQGGDYLALAGPGFRDFTRIAAAEPTMWRDILLANRHDVLDQLRFFQQAVHSFVQRMEDDDGRGLADLITQASNTRAGWSMASFTPKT